MLQYSIEFHKRFLLKFLQVLVRIFSRVYLRHFYRNSARKFSKKNLQYSPEVVSLTWDLLRPFSINPKDSFRFFPGASKESLQWFFQKFRFRNFCPLIPFRQDILSRIHPEVYLGVFSVHFFFVFRTSFRNLFEDFFKNFSSAFVSNFSEFLI